MINSEGSMEDFSQLLNTERVDFCECKQVAYATSSVYGAETDSLSATMFDLLSYPVKDVNAVTPHIFPNELLFCTSNPSTSGSLYVDSSLMLNTKNLKSDLSQAVPQIVSLDNSSMQCLTGSSLNSTLGYLHLPQSFQENGQAITKHRLWQEEKFALEHLKNLPLYESDITVDDESQICNNGSYLPYCNATSPVSNTGNSSALNSDELQTDLVEDNTGISNSFQVLLREHVRYKRSCDSFTVTENLNSLPSVPDHDPVLTCNRNNVSFLPFSMLENSLLHSSPDYDYSLFSNMRDNIHENPEPSRFSPERNASSFDLLSSIIASPSTISFDSPAASGLEYLKTSTSNHLQCVSLHPTKGTTCSDAYFHNHSDKKNSLRTNVDEELHVDSNNSCESPGKLSVTMSPNLKEEGSKKRCQEISYLAREDPTAKRRLELRDGNSCTLTRSSSCTSGESCCNLPFDREGDRKISMSSKEFRNQALNMDNMYKPRAGQGCANDSQSIAARIRRERISERLKILQNLVPNGTKVDQVTMLEKAISYVKFLQLQVKVLSSDDYWPNQETSKMPSSDNSQHVSDGVPTDGIKTEPGMKPDQAQIVAST
ncbi:hypothetical protein O6H91_15G018400 [Diphasiastrum complanatum]|uniref:Uncharacterized protein n=1 Tax=Diphasiastrum complanatum TaxID=34168 RepID=A0ACC2BG32_DIPCM|nr:hypothetical protein O6H91_15G018400 [Diphasiastrum complanatum]